MKKHFQYLSYVIRHKWFVALACWRYGIVWQGIVHDWSKFLPSEWLPYVDYFYGEKCSEAEMKQACRVLGYNPYPDPVRMLDAFNVAWLKHQHRSPHHWQHWVLREDRGTTMALKMPHRYVLEMLADWEGAGRAITGRSGGTAAWYARNRANMILHPATQEYVDWALDFDPAIPCQT